MIRYRLPLLMLGAIALVVGMLAGLSRLGVPTPIHSADLALAHGPLMVGAFLGAVIGLERAVALRSLWVYGAPLASGLGGLALILGLPAGPFLLALGGLVLAGAAIEALRRQTALFTLFMAAGAVALPLGHLLWLLGRDLSQVVPFWVAFLVLTIAGERLELARFLPPSPGRARTAVLPLGLTALALTGAALGQEWAARVFGLGLVALTFWLLAYDIARRTVRETGLTRYIALALLSGYVWLGLAGVATVAVGLPAGGPIYDAILHALFVGFVFAMIFGHAPVILPAVLKVQLPYHPVFIALLGLLHLSLAVRVAGDLAGSADLRAAGGIANALVIVLFLATAAGRVLSAPPKPD